MLGNANIEVVQVWRRGRQLHIRIPGKPGNEATCKHFDMKSLKSYTYFHGVASESKHYAKYAT